jgi:DNA topoisomerase-1
MFRGEKEILIARDSQLRFDGRSGDYYNFTLLQHEQRVARLFASVWRMAGKAGDRRNDDSKHTDDISRFVENGVGLKIIRKRPDKAFDPNQPRDETGKWTSDGGGGGGDGGAPVISGEAPVAPPVGGAASTGGMRPLDRENPPAHLANIRIPPAWTDVQYNTDPDAALQVSGRDAKGRVVALYSAKHTSEAAAAKFERVNELIQRYDEIEQANEAAKQDPERRDAADTLDLIMKMGLRPGSERDTGAARQAYGATTLEGRHVLVRESGHVALHFRGKKGVEIHLPVKDPQLAAMLRERKERIGSRDKLFNVTDAELRQHVDTIGASDFHVKDFRTRVAARTAATEVAKIKRLPKTPKDYKKRVRDVADTVAKQLGNTRAIALQSYIPPEIFSGWRASAGV